MRVRAKAAESQLRKLKTDKELWLQSGVASLLQETAPPPPPPPGASSAGTPPGPPPGWGPDDSASGGGGSAGAGAGGSGANPPLETNISSFLERLGLSKYVETFEENEVDMEVRASKEGQV